MATMRQPRSSKKQSWLSGRDWMMMVIGATIPMFVFQIQRSQELFHEPTQTLLLPSMPTSLVGDHALSSKDSGWNPIHVFYGRIDHLTKSLDSTKQYWIRDVDPFHNGTEWFSQHGQDKTVAQFFNYKSGGYFVDLAANDALFASNSFILEHNFQWKGICIEVNPMYWYRLSFRSNCHVVGAIVGEQDFQEVQVTLGKGLPHLGPFGGIVGDGFDNKKNPKRVDEPRYTVSLKTILQRFDAPKVIDYLSLDVEGAETFILRKFPFEEYKFLAMSIERPSEELRGILEKHGYKHVMDFKRGDTLWAHPSVYEQGRVNLEKASSA